MRGRFALLALCVAAAAVNLRADPASDAAYAATARKLTVIKNQPLLLEAFLREMPKGGDLHYHLTGSIYAETYVRWAAEGNMCIVTATFTVVTGACDAAAGRPAASAVLQDSALYNATIDAWSMRNWPLDRNGHDHFFATFSKFNGATINRLGDMLAEVTARAASERVSYMELMLTPDGGIASRLGREAGWNPDFAQMRTRLLAAGFGEILTQSKLRLDAAEARRNELLKCGTTAANPGCGVTVRYLSQVLRAEPPEQVFAQMLAGFEVAAVEPRVVGINLVQPEDDPVAVRYFSLQLSMLDFLHKLYPAVRIALHAGEIAEGLVPPEVLRFHIRDSIRQGHALRIGHGVGVMQENDPFGLLREMAGKKILVEIALTSNDFILGVKGIRQPLALYLQYGVPVALATDDLGVSRSTHTREWVKAVLEHGLDYRTLKGMVRNSVEYAFADASTKTRLKQNLEKEFLEFERRQAAAPARVIDSHCHLADEVFAPDLEAVIARARAAGIERAMVILSAGDPAESAQAARVEALWPDVRFAIGVHPHHAHQFADRPARAADIAREQCAATAGVRAIGEIGLDYHYDFSPRDVQIEVFRAQIRLARELRLPVVIHTRDADDDTIAILREDGGGEVSGVLHCFTGGPSLARAGLDLGFYISLAGIVTFPKAADLRETVRAVPVDRLLTETDSPFLAPVPHRGTRNEPAHVARVAEALGALHGLGGDDLGRRAAANFHTLFRP